MNKYIVIVQDSDKNIVQFYTIELDCDIEYAKKNIVATTPSTYIVLVTKL